MNSRNRRRRGFSLIELLIVIAIILILAGIALPKINQQRMLANETAVKKELQSIQAAQTQYYSQFNRYATSLTELGPPVGGATGPSGADLITKTLAEGKHNGYVYTLQATQQGYAVNANPESFGGTGRRTFFSDQSGVIRENWAQEPANAQSPESK
jgi:prepilin-type N-terminal cleavage/methylation domain-containing protein